MRWLCCGIACLLAAGGFAFGQGTGDREQSVAAFKQIARVMRSPRCMNCHTTSDFPRQGDSRRRHDQSVQRGVDDRGVAPMQCSSCHQDDNSPGGGYVPGASEWHLAPRSMSWEQARSDKELCDGLPDKTRNGNREARGMVIHMTNDPLVQWAWSPGSTRAPPPIGQDDFHQLLQRWVATGAACPPSD